MDKEENVSGLGLRVVERVMYGASASLLWTFTWCDGDG